MSIDFSPRRPGRCLTAMRLLLSGPLLPTLLRRGLLIGGSLALALCFYADLLPDRGGAAACARELGYDPRSYGARFSPQCLLNGSVWWSTNIYRYSMSATDFARLKADLLTDGWTFYDGTSDGVLGTVAGKYYVDVIDNELEVAYPGQLISGDSWCLNYNHTDGRLYIEQRFGSWAK